jgi:hypothetical protein
MGLLLSNSIEITHITHQVLAKSLVHVGLGRVVGLFASMKDTGTIR